MFWGKGILGDLVNPEFYSSKSLQTSIYIVAFLYSNRKINDTPEVCLA